MRTAIVFIFSLPMGLFCVAGFVVGFVGCGLRAGIAMADHFVEQLAEWAQED